MWHFVGVPVRRWRLPLQVCLSPAMIVRGHRPLTRLLFSGLLHGDDMHLYYNMVSLLWKGAQLERSMGTKKLVVRLSLSHFVCVRAGSACAC